MSYNVLLFQSPSSLGSSSSQTYPTSLLCLNLVLFLFLFIYLYVYILLNNPSGPIYTARYGAIHWSTVEVPGAIPLKKTDSPSPKAFTVHNSSVREGMVNTTPSLHARISPGLLLCRSQWAASAVESSREQQSWQVQRTLFCSHPPNLCLLQSPCSSPAVVPEPWGGAHMSVRYRRPVCDATDSHSLHLDEARASVHC